MSFWTREKEEILEAMLKEGNSYSIIGAKLGCSRNAAIGKAKRLGISAAPVQKITKPRKRRTREEIMKDIEKRVEKKPLIRPVMNRFGRVSAKVNKDAKARKPMRERIRLSKELRTEKGYIEYMSTPKEYSVSDITDIPGHYECHWITGDVKAGKGIWCRNPAHEGTMWCKYHLEKVYVPGTAFSNRKLKRKY